MAIFGRRWLMESKPGKISLFGGADYYGAWERGEEGALACQVSTFMKQNKFSFTKP